MAKEKEHFAVKGKTFFTGVLNFYTQAEKHFLPGIDGLHRAGDRRAGFARNVNEAKPGAVVVIAR